VKVKKPAIILSSLDVDRLEALLENADNPALEAELERAKVVDPKKVPANAVTMNSTVRFCIEETNETFERTLVYPKDMDNPETKISVWAPIGTALLGLKVGDSMPWPSKGKEAHVVIQAITYQPEQAGEHFR
jgi:regulator of nucleoside diphosphate kinase